MARGFLAGITLALGVAGSTAAQDPRAAQVSRALEEFDTGRRLQLLLPALDPSVGPLTDAWATGVQLLAQTLMEAGRDSLADVYLRWAARLSPDLQIDTVQFLPKVGTAYERAAEFVGSTRGAGDSLVVTTWRWPSEAMTDSAGGLQVTAPSVPAGLNASAEGVGLLRPDTRTSLPPGSYRVSAAAPGYDSLAVTREVLPGVTTMLELRPRQSTAVAAKPQIPPQNAVVEPRRGKKFPVALILGGAAAVGVVAAVAGGGGGGGGGGDTGGIRVTFPDF